MGQDNCRCASNVPVDRRVLAWLLGINGVMFVAELLLGIMADSTALIADSLDMLADAGVYAIAGYAIGKAEQVKVRAAMLSGVAQIALGTSVIVEVIRRLLVGSEPESIWMLAVGLAALLANLLCLYLLYRYRRGEIHMRASWIFSSNDVIANIGVILAGVLVLWLQSSLPDIIIGFVIAAVIVRGGMQIIGEARRETRSNAGGI